MARLDVNSGGQAIIKVSIPDSSTLLPRNQFWTMTTATMQDRQPGARTFLGTGQGRPSSWVVRTSDRLLAGLLERGAVR